MHILMQMVSSKLIFSVTRIDRKDYIRVYSRVNEKPKRFKENSIAPLHLQVKKAASLFQHVYRHPPIG